jgi:hypothetical protein
MSFFTDKIAIVPTSQDEWGQITESPDVETKARIEDFNDLIKDQNGNEVMANTLVIIPRDQIVKYPYFIKLIEKNRIAYKQPLKKWSIKKIYGAGMFKKHHIEVYL